MKTTTSFTRIIINEIEDTKKLLRSVPALVMVFFVIGTVSMNLLANRQFDIHLSWISLDCGFTVSWLSFLCMDMLAKRYGGKASFKLSLVAEGINLIMCMIFFVVSLIPGTWSEYFTYMDENVNLALDATFAGTWFVIVGSTIAFIVSAGVNSIINMSVAKLAKHDSFKAYAARSWISTCVAQFVDNMLFATIVSHTFFGWTWLQVLMCSFTGMIVELLCEIIFSPIGYKVCRKWQAEGVGDDYLKSL